MFNDFILNILKLHKDIFWPKIKKWNEVSLVGGLPETASKYSVEKPHPHAYVPLLPRFPHSDLLRSSLSELKYQFLRNGYDVEKHNNNKGTTRKRNWTSTRTHDHHSYRKKMLFFLITDYGKGCVTTGKDGWGRQSTGKDG